MRIVEGSWAWSAQRVIDPIFTQAKREGWTKEQFEKEIYDAYPFGEREMFPYKMWLKVRKLYMDRWQGQEEIKKSYEEPSELELSA